MGQTKFPATLWVRTLLQVRFTKKISSGNPVHDAGVMGHRLGDVTFAWFLLTHMRAEAYHLQWDGGTWATPWVQFGRAHGPPFG